MAVHRIPELLLPLVAKDVVRPGEGVLTFWHDTMIVIIPDGGRLLLTYKPRKGYVYLVFDLTMGRPRDHDTGDVLVTDDYGFWHRHGQMRWHWNPGVESVYEFGEPQFLVVTEEDPLEMGFYNNSGVTVVQDITVWLFECGEKHWSLVARYLRGLFRALYDRGGGPEGAG